MIGFAGIAYSISKGWIAIEQNTGNYKELKEQVTRQYSTHTVNLGEMKKDFDKQISEMKKDHDEELDVLEEELDKLKAEVQWHIAYEQAMKDHHLK